MSFHCAPCNMLISDMDSHRRMYHVESERPGPCTRRNAAGEAIGEACPECGHTNVVHPGRANPALDACVLCVMLANL